MTKRKIFSRFCNNIRHFSNEINKRGGWISSFCGEWNFSQLVSVDSTSIREIRVSRLRQASQRKMIQSSALRLRLWLFHFKIFSDNPAFWVVGQTRQRAWLERIPRIIYSPQLKLTHNKEALIQNFFCDNNPWFVTEA